MIIYFARPTDTYDKRIESDCMRLIEKTFPGIEIVDPKGIFKTIENDANKLTGKEREKFISEHTMAALKTCDTIVYTNTFTAAKHMNFPKGLMGEIYYGLKNKYRMFRIYLCGHNGNINTAQVKKIQEINFVCLNEKTKNDFNKYTIEKQGWILKSITDYLQFYKNNSGAIDLMRQWFTDVEHIGAGCVVSHPSHVFATNNRTNIGLVNCRIHYGMQHATIDPCSQLYNTECPYVSYKKFSPEYATNKLTPFPTDDEQLLRLIARSRVIHKFWEMFDSKANLTQFGIALQDENGNLVKKKDGHYIADTRLIPGVRPLVDIDIKAEVKSKYNFFNDKIFKEYEIAIEKLLEYLGDEARLQFSGNGIYIELEPMDFKKEDTTYDEFEAIWKGNNLTKKLGQNSEMEKMQNILEIAGIKYLTLERYSWNQYFKLPMTFHADYERVSIPINKDVSFDTNMRKYIDEMSSIKRGLNENIYDEIMRNAGNKWR